METRAPAAIDAHLSERRMFRDAPAPGLRAALRFEVVSFLGRALLRRPPPDVGSPRLLNLGCGSARLDGWVNADFYALRFWMLPRNYWALDLRHPLRCPANYWDGVLCEHTLEHLDPSSALRLLKEIHRTLRPGSWVRLVVPDLGKYLAACNGQLPAAQFDQWSTAPEMIWNLTQNYGHRSTWDGPQLVSALGAAGFINCRETRFRNGTDARLLRDLESRAWESVYAEGRKPPAS